jgi:predicted kinase
MRKWMSERLKRRKKESAKGANEAAQAPLQPAFYDTGPATDATPVKMKEPEPESARPKPSASQAEERPSYQDDVNPDLVHHDKKLQESTSPPGIQHGANDDARRNRRRRRGRGGRGRTRGATSSSGAKPPVNQAPLPPAPASHVSETSGPGAASTSVVPARTPKGVVVLAIGLPGSGKSSWFKRHQITPLSSDLLRVLLFDDATEQRFQDLIFSNLRSMLKARLIARRPTNYVDATNLTPHERQSWIKLAKDYGYEVQAVFFDVPVEVCLERNQRRERIVPEDVMRRMAAKLRAPTFQEGFAKITVVKVKKREGEPAAD